MKDNIKVVNTPAGSTWAEVATFAASKVAENMEYLKESLDHKLHLVLPNGDGVIVDSLTNTTLSVMPGKGWDHFDKYGLHQPGNALGVMIDHDAFTPPNGDLEASATEEAIMRLRIAFIRSSR